MPPKQAPASTSVDEQSSSVPRNVKASKTSAQDTAPEKSTESEAKTFKYCNANTLSKKPKYMNLEWPNIHDFIKDKNQDMPKKGELIDDFCNRVSDLGIPVSDDGRKIYEKLDDEFEKRDQDARGMHIYNDWNGWGMSEVMENLLKDFNRDIFKKTISPFKKWAYVEGLACFFKEGDMMYLIRNENGPAVQEIITMLGVMVLTTYDMLAEHELFKPESDIKNIGIISLLILELLLNEAVDLDTSWGREVVRLCDDAGIDLGKQVRKQVSVSEEQIAEYRQDVKDNLGGWMVGEDETDHENNMYKYYAEMDDWTPKKDDVDDDGGRGDFWPKDRMWYRWDWAVEYPQFRENHEGGTHYDLTKRTKRDREADFSIGIGDEFDSEWETDSDSGLEADSE